MRRLVTVSAVLLTLAPVIALAQQPATLFDHLAGKWVLRGVIDKQQVTHDVDAQQVLNGGYVRLHEVSREKDAQGAPAYEAIVFFSVDKKSGEYAALWLDNTSNAGLAADAAVGRAMPKGNALPFVFKSRNGDTFHTTFVYTPATDSWQWLMDAESKGKIEPFARVTLTRADR